MYINNKQSKREINKTILLTKKDSTICCLQDTHFKYKDMYRPNIKGWRKIYYANSNQRKAGIILAISEINCLCHFWSKKNYQR